MNVVRVDVADDLEGRQVTYALAAAGEDRRIVIAVQLLTTKLERLGEVVLGAGAKLIERRQRLI